SGRSHPKVGCDGAGSCPAQRPVRTTSSQSGAWMLLPIRPLAPLLSPTTSEIEPIDGLVGQQRAVEAIGFGTRVRKPGFNLFVIGSSGARMQQAVGSVLRQAAQEMPSPPDWVYVNNFSEPHKPIAIELPPGRALEFRGAMRELVDDLKTALPAVFESEDYQTRREAIDQ